MKMKRLLSLLLCLVLVSAFIVPTGARAEQLSMSNFDPYTATYNYGQFSDVNEGAWYGLENQGVVATACGLGLMNGTGGGFSPDGNLTIAQVVTMAARICSIYYDDGHKFVQGTPWYQCYVDYAEEENILYGGEFEDEMNRAATRAEMAYLLYFALSDDEFTQINNVTSLPDVSSSNEYLRYILCLYNAGILTGNDAYGTFTPDAPITRAAAAAIVSRMALPELRKEFTLTPPQSAQPTAWEYANGAHVSTFSELEAVMYSALDNGVSEFCVTCPFSVTNAMCDTLIDDFWCMGLQSVSSSLYGSDLTISCDSSVAQVAALYNNPAVAKKYCSSTMQSYSSKIAALANSLKGSSEYETAKNIHDYMVKNYRYDESFGYDCREFYSLLNSGKGVCEAYSELYYLLTTYSGIKGYMVFGSTGEDHSWNYVCLDGRWGFVDVTWDDPVPDRGASAAVIDDYFFISSSELSNDHSWSLSSYVAMG